MPKHCATQARIFEFAIWASRRQRAPSLEEVRAFFGCRLMSARRIRNTWLQARSTVAAAVARRCAERIEADSHRPPSTTDE